LSTKAGGMAPPAPPAGGHEEGLCISLLLSLLIH